MKNFLNHCGRSAASTTSQISIVSALDEDIESDLETLKKIKDTVDPITPERDAKLQS